MLSRDGSRSTRSALLAAALSLALATQALGQAPVAPSPPATDSGSSAASAAPLPGGPPSIAVPPPSATPSTATPSTTPPGSAIPLPPTTAAANPPPAENETLLAYSLASVPDMIGDTLGGRYDVFFRFVGASGATTIPLAGGGGYAKIADDTSPIPTDRVFFDYDYFNHAVRTANGALIGLNRYTFGVEKTFFDGNCSLEIEAPFDTGLADNQVLDGTTAGNQGTVFGDISLTLKCLVYQGDSLAVSVGTMVDVPTAPNGAYILDPDSLTIHNDSVHVAPFLGFAYAPNPNFFAIGFAQVDFDTNGDAVDEEAGLSDPFIGRLRDPSLLYLDLSTGYWLFRDEPRCGRYLTGIAPVVELHYTTTLENYPGVNSTIVPAYAGTDCLNLTAGVHFQMGPCSMLTLAAVVPLLTSPRDEEFDSEVDVQFDRRF